MTIGVVRFLITPQSVQERNLRGYGGEPPPRVENFPVLQGKHGSTSAGQFTGQRTTRELLLLKKSRRATSEPLTI